MTLKELYEKLTEKVQQGPMVDTDPDEGQEAFYYEVEASLINELQATLMVLFIQNGDDYDPCKDP